MRFVNRQNSVWAAKQLTIAAVDTIDFNIASDFTIDCPRAEGCWFVGGDFCLAAKRVQLSALGDLHGFSAGDVRFSAVQRYHQSYGQGLVMKVADQITLKAKTIQVDAGQSICLQTKGAKIELSADGVINLSAQTLNLGAVNYVGKVSIVPMPVINTMPAGLVVEKLEPPIWQNWHHAKQQLTTTRLTIQLLSQVGSKIEPLTSDWPKITYRICFVDLMGYLLADDLVESTLTKGSVIEIEDVPLDQRFYVQLWLVGQMEAVYVIALNNTPCRPTTVLNVLSACGRRFNHQRAGHCITVRQLQLTVLRPGFDCLL